MRISDWSSDVCSSDLEGAWVPLDEKPFVTTDWRHQAIALVGASGPARVMFDTTGAAVASLTVTLVRNDERAAVSVAVDSSEERPVGNESDSTVRSRWSSVN